MELHVFRIVSVSIIMSSALHTQHNLYDMPIDVCTVMDS